MADTEVKVKESLSKFLRNRYWEEKKQKEEENNRYYSESAFALSIGMIPQTFNRFKLSQNDTMNSSNVISLIAYFGLKEFEEGTVVDQFIFNETFTERLALELAVLVAEPAVRDVILSMAKMPPERRAAFAQMIVSAAADETSDNQAPNLLPA